MSDNTKKLRVLRARTDHDLLILIQRELERGFALADVATTRSSPLFAQAQAACEKARTLLTKISGLSQNDRAPIEATLKGLRSRLDQVPTPAKESQYPLSCAW